MSLGLPDPPALEPNRVTTVLCDLDGVVWLDHEPIDGAVAAIAGLRASGRRVLFVTNNSAALIADHEQSLGIIGVPAVGDVVSSSMAAAMLIEPGERVLVTGGPGVAEAVERRGAIALVNDGQTTHDAVDVVIVGLHRDFDYHRLAIASAALHRGARLIGTNSDSTYPTPRGLEPGGGSILAAVAAAGEAVPAIGGKPHPPMASLIADSIGHGAGSGSGGSGSGSGGSGGSGGDATFDPSTVVMVGDRPETDGLMAATIGCPFALVRSGVTRPGQRLVDRDVAVSLDVADLAAVALVIIGAEGV